MHVHNNVDCLLLLVLLLLFLSRTLSSTTTPPFSFEQVHLAPGRTDDAITVTFLTVGGNRLAENQMACVKLRLANDEHGDSAQFAIVIGSSSYVELYQEVIRERWQATIHRVQLTDLHLGSVYNYTVGICNVSSSSSASAEEQFCWWLDSYFQFRTPDLAADQFRVAFIADIGTYDASMLTLRHLERDLDSFDLILIGGDITYSSQWETDPPRQLVNDQFYRLFQPIAARVPVVAVPGNHERYDWNFRSFTLRTGDANPKQSSNSSDRFFSFETRSVRFIGLSSEDSTAVPNSDQYQFLKREKDDYAQRNSSSTWVVLFSHNPQYSSNLAHGSDLILRTNIEPLEKDFVNVVLAGHEHIYERTFPVSNAEVPEEFFSENETAAHSESVTDVYESPSLPVHVLNGNCGARLYTNWLEPAPRWSRVRSSAYFGYTKLTFTRSNNSLLVQSLDNENNRIRDSFVIQRPKQQDPEPTTPVPTTPEQTTPSPTESTSFFPATTAPLESTTGPIATTPNATGSIPPHPLAGGTGFAMYLSGILVMILLVMVVPLFITIRLCCRRGNSAAAASVELESLASFDEVAEEEDERNTPNGKTESNTATTNGQRVNEDA